MKLILQIYILFLIAHNAFSQGVYNNGANIVFSGAAQMYINGVGSGHYLSATATTGSITASATSSITLLGNWTNNTINKGFATPDGGGVVLAGNAQTIGGSAATAFYNLTLAGNGVKTLAVNSTTVGGQATFTGILAIGTSTLNLNSNRLDVTNSAIGAITSGAAGYILSETSFSVNPSIVRWYMRTTTGAHIYPFGVAASKIPFTFNITVAMAGASDYIDVSTRATPASNNAPWAGVSNFAAVTNMYSPNLPSVDGSIPDVVDRWWDVTNSSAVTASLTFSYRGTENTLTGANAANIGAQYWDGAHWMPNNATYGSAAGVTGATIGSVTTPAVNKFCPWILSSVINPLPIELLNFDVSCVNNRAKLEWCTASELNNHHFTVEYSIDGVNFEPIGIIAGSGTTELKHCYSFTSNSSIADIGYYRLVQTDINGNSKTFNVVSLEGCGTSSGNMTLTNNGTKEVGVLVNSLSDATIDLYVYNSLGQILEIKSLEIKKGYNTLRVNLNNVSNALYYISAYKGNVLQTSKKIIVSDIGN
jgi:hypothetical protein